MNNLHSSKYLNLGTALRQSPTGPFTRALFYWPLPLLGFHPIIIAGSGAIATIYGFWTHTQLIKKLEGLAVITEAQSCKAIKYLRQHEKEWPTDLEVESGARLFLDSLSITYLMTVEMLDKLSEAGFEVFVFRGERDRYRSLINYDSIIEQADSKIENNTI